MTEKELNDFIIEGHRTPAGDRRVTKPVEGELRCTFYSRNPNRSYCAVIEKDDGEFHVERDIGKIEK